MDFLTNQGAELSILKKNENIVVWNAVQCNFKERKIKLSPHPLLTRL